MKDKLRVANFKCFKEVELELPNLTVLVGANGTGKSTVIQSLLLIRNAKETISNSVLLNGPYGLELGTNASVIYQEAENDILYFEVVDELDDLVFKIN